MEKRNIIICAIAILTIAFVISGMILKKDKLEICNEIKCEVIENLKVENGSIKNERGENVILQGISSHGIQWFDEVLTKNAFIYLKNEFKINAFRIAIYVNDNADYNVYEKLYPIIDDLLDLNLYVIIDWHILEYGDPNKYIMEASEFFSIVSEKYANIPNILYEICNEPNSNVVTWDENIKPYAEKIIPIIRENSPNSLIIVGTPDYCKKVNKPADNPLEYENIVYSVHFYSGTDGKAVKDNIEYAKEKGIAILVSEWGTTDNTGDGEIFEEESREWIEFLKEKNIGYINWSFCNKKEGSAILNSEYDKENELVIHKYLTKSGKLVRKIYNEN